MKDQQQFHYMNNGWIKLHKKFIDSPIWKYSIQSKLPHLISCWIYLLISVNWEEKKWYDGKEEIIIPKGSMITSIGNLADALSLTDRQVRTALKHYENMKMITRKTSNKWTQIWIVNWGKYQSIESITDKQDDNQMSNGSQTDVKPMSTTKEYKNIRIKDNTGKSPELKTKEWQEKALRAAEFIKVELPDTFRSRWFKLFKDLEGTDSEKNLSRALGYVVDHPTAKSSEQKILLFFSLAQNGFRQN